MLATYYAKTLYELGGKSEHLGPLRVVLARRGHMRLLPGILAEYQKLELGAKRLAAHKAQTKERVRTRTLLELYRRLTR